MNAARVTAASLLASRASGEPFEEAWPVAVAAGLAAARGNERREWREALADARPAFERAYAGERQTSAEAAAASLGAA